jgi:uncharacterized membrane protein YagU involved in acid resistance
MSKITDLIQRLDLFLQDDLKKQEEKMKTFARGFWSGIFSTSIMTIGFFRLFKILRREEQAPLPPAQITDELSRKMGVSHKLTSPELENLTLLNHFGYGITFSLLYSALPQQYKTKPFVAGNLYGTVIWGLSYLGLLPAFNLKSTAYQMPPQKNAIMILLHLLWGSTLAYSDSNLKFRAERFLDSSQSVHASPDNSQQLTSSAHI